jgi:hypothetical protein
MKFTVDRLREEALQILREEEATKFIISPAGRENQIRVEINRARIAESGKGELRDYIEKVRTHISELRSRYGVKAPPSVLIKFLEDAESAPPGQVTFPTVTEMRSYFHDYAKVWPDSEHLPAHTRIIFDAHGSGPNGQPIIGIRLLEASIYEDMAALWNLLHERSVWHYPEATQTQRKTHHALCRSTLATVIYFVEAYLNGLAFDHLVRHAGSVSDEEKSILSDWDFARNCPTEPVISC